MFMDQHYKLLNIQIAQQALSRACDPRHLYSITRGRLSVFWLSELEINPSVNLYYIQ